MNKIYALEELRDRKKPAAKTFKKFYTKYLGKLIKALLPPKQKLELSHYNLEFEKLKAPLTVLQLSDLHVNSYVSHETISSWFDLASQQEVDLIVITGDFFDYLLDENNNFLISQLARLTAPLGVIAIWGNHDYDKGQAYLDDFKAKLESINIRVLCNEGFALREDVFLAGLDDVRQGKPDLKQSLTGYKSEQFCLFLAHVPDVIPLLPLSVDLCLCGHTHGGQVVLPFVGITKTSSYYGKAFASGWIENPVKAYVSRGLGYSTLPIRLNCAAELALFTLEPKKE